MEKLGIQLLMAAVTAFAGVIVYVGGQLTVKLIIEPIQALRHLMGEISISVESYRSLSLSSVKAFERQMGDLFEGTAPDFPARARADAAAIRHQEQLFDAADTLHGQACELRGIAATIPKYRRWAARGIVPKQEDLIAATRSLEALSVALLTDPPPTDRSEHAKNVVDKLNLWANVYSNPSK